MAKRFALVPESWLEARNEQVNAPKTANLSDISPKTNGNLSNLTETMPKTKTNLGNMAELLPKNLKTRGRVVFHYLENGNVNVNDVQRIVYSDGAVGSHVLDLIRYAISPFVKTRPLDWPQFRKLLESLGVPESALANKNNNDLLSQWKKY